MFLLMAELSTSFIHHKQNMKFPQSCSSNVNCGKYSEKSVLVVQDSECPETLSEAQEMSLINVQAICEIQVRIINQ